MTIAPTIQVNTTFHSQTSPVAFAEDAASAVTTQVALDADLNAEQATLLQETLTASMAPWFNKVAEIERGHVARYLSRRSNKVSNGQMLGAAASDALASAAESLMPQVRRTPARSLADPWGPASA